MKIAVATEYGNIFEHFGGSKNFTIYHIKDKQIIKEEEIASPEHKPGVFPNFLASQGVNVVIGCGMGKAAIEIFKEKNIEVIIGASGNAKDSVISYLLGELKSKGSACTHNHNGEGHH